MRRKSIDLTPDGEYTDEMYDWAARTLEGRLWFMPPCNTAWAPGGSEREKAVAMPPKERWEFVRAAAAKRGDPNAERVLPQAHRRLTKFPTPSELRRRANAA